MYVDTETNKCMDVFMPRNTHIHAEHVIISNLSELLYGTNLVLS